MRFTNKINFRGNIIKYKAKQFVTERKNSSWEYTVYTGKWFWSSNYIAYMWEKWGNISTFSKEIRGIHAGWNISNPTQYPFTCISQYIPSKLR